MKNITDSSIRFSVITEGELIQTGYLDAALSTSTQYIPYIPGNIYVLQEVDAASIADVLVAERSGEDLIVTLKNQETSQPHLVIENFFTHNGQLHQITQNGEFVLSLSAQDNPQQGQVTFDAQSLGHVEQQPQQMVLSMLHEVSATESNNVSAESIEAAPAMAMMQMAAVTQDVTPVITRAIDQLGARQGALKSGNVTDDQWSVLEGNGTPGATLEIFDNGRVIGEVLVDNTGQWSFEPQEKYSESGHVLVARDKTSGVSSDTFSLIIDSVAPSRAVIDSIGNDSTTIAKNGYTNNNQPLIKGHAEAFSVVGIYNGKNMIGTALADATGAWEFSPAFRLPDDSYTISAKAVDFAGNSGLGSLNYVITIDTIPPAVPTILEASDNFGVQQGPLASGDLTDDRTPQLSGKAEANVTVFIYDKGNLLGTTKADGKGDWSFEPTTLSDGEHRFTASARDLAGNTSQGESDTFTLILGEDRTTTPTIDSITDNAGSVTGLLEHGAHTDDTTPTLRGTAQAGNTVKIFDNGILIAETIANGANKWSYEAKDLTEGKHVFEVQAFDTIHSPSKLSAAFDIVLDLTPPDATNLRIIGFYDDVGSNTGYISQGGRTDDRNPTISGTGPAGEDVIIYVTDSKGQREIGRAHVEDNGFWKLDVTSTLNYGKQTFTVVAVDDAGNATKPSAGYGVTITTNDSVGGFDLIGSLNQTSGGPINTTVIGHQNNPQVTKLANGNLVVVWQGVNVGYDVYLQVLDPTGTKKIGSEQMVNQRIASNQDSPQVIALVDGGFVVVYESYHTAPDSNLDGVMARQYDANGVPKGSEFLVNTTTAGAQREPGGLALTDGGYILSWYSAQDKESIVQQRYDEHSNRVGTETVIKAGGANSVYGGPELALLGDSGWYATVWAGTDSYATGIQGKLQKLDGSASVDLKINTAEKGYQNYPDIISLKDGSFVVFWDSTHADGQGDIVVAHYRFDPETGSATKLDGGDFIANEYRANKQYKPVGVPLDDGGYMLIWGSETGDGYGSGIFAQRFDANSHKIGHEFLVNPTTWGNQGSGWDNLDLTHILDATLTKDGNIFVTFHSEVIDRDGYGIEGVTIDLDAGFYSEFQVNSVTTANQKDPQTTALSDGRFVTMWVSGDAGNWDIKSQLFDDTGMPIGPEVLVSSAFSKYTQYQPELTTLSDGTFVAVWRSNEPGQINLRMARFDYAYDENGQVIGTRQIGEEQIVNAASNANDMYNPSVIALDDGGYLITWQKGVDGWQGMSRQYNSEGKPVTGEMVIGTGRMEQVAFALEGTTLHDGKVALTYSNYGNGYDVRVQIYDPVTHTYGPAFIANETVAGIQAESSITTLANGNFVVSWRSSDNSGFDQSGYGVYARIFSPEGQSLSGEFLLNGNTTSEQIAPVVKANPNGGFVAVYQSAIDPVPGAGTYGIYLQAFDENGNRIGQEMRVNQITAGTQQEPDVTFLSDGRLYVTWTDAGVGEGSGSSIKGRLIDLDTTLNDALVTTRDTNIVSPPSESNTTGSDSLWMLLDDGSASGLYLSGESLSAVQGGSGNDLIGVKNTSFTSIDGGDGIDTLLLDGKNMALDLDALVGCITGIEKIDLGQGSANSMSLSASALEGLGQTDMVMADGKNQLVINGDESNALKLLDTQSESWMAAGDAEIGGVIYHTYVAGATELLVEQNIHVTVM
ncbi:MULTISPECIES: Ig-like domain-containing protein [unclassified Serratia (in: enterobacteria)]|uniref:Ig-like domain-containing protein n=1 Tax=unclassified Serratia (in: enterobacteria) TaxID=2647522 RepID=UPI000502FEBF|nr:MULTISPECIES: Ig-like domain-containing protein [unclassified Serratia (in: enterobacteria)]KFK94907.1 hypothetical protein JV45_09775 [Serratia sp. Ag2]KFK97030.1 hypothetical protein IV04_17115 [Serratia sp. Ag1]